MSEWLKTNSESLKVSFKHSSPRAGLSPDDTTHSLPVYIQPALPGPIPDPFDKFSAHTTYAMLSGDPVLRLYATDMFVHHAAAANHANADPSELLDMLHNDQILEVAKGCWQKWCQLHDVPRLYTNPVYFAVRRDLKTWIEWYSASPSHRNMLVEWDGDMGYPLLAAIVWGHRSIAACLSDHINAEVPGSARKKQEAWALLHRLVAETLKADTTLARRRFNHDMVEELLNLIASKSDDVLSLRFSSYMVTSRINVRAFENMLVRIQPLSSTVDISETEPQHENTAKLFLDNLFLNAIN